MGLFLGVDGGQSSTVALIADDAGRVLGEGRGGPCNHVTAAAGQVKFSRAIGQCLQEACLKAGLDAREVAFDAACLGFSGGITDKDAYSRALIRSSAFKITHDAEIALTGATGGAAGIIAIAGTGSIAFGKNEAGEMRRAGGWGYIFGDEGGAFDLVRQALRAALAMEEGWGQYTDLRNRLLVATGATCANELLHEWYNNLDRTAVATLAPVLDESAGNGDAVAMKILAAAGQDLAALVERVHRTLFPLDMRVPVSYVGGVFASRPLRDEWSRAVFSALRCEAAPPLFPPAAGALLEALRLNGNTARLSHLPSIKS